jgi:preprotein translocase subunit SecF
MTDTITPQTASEPPVEKRSIWHRLYHGETTFDFMGRRKIGFIISTVLIVLTLLSLFTRGLNLGLDFEGGVAWEVPANSLTVSDVDSILAANGIDPSSAKVQTLRGTDGQRIRVQVGTQTNEVQSAVRTQLSEKASVDIQEVSLNSVSATWGNEITKKALRALVIFLIAISIYITFRFEWRMAIGALIAVVHDVLISVGIYSIFQWEVTPATVIAFLTILGFSLYDTIVVFDKVHENTRRLSTGKYTYDDIVNLSMNQVLMRSINTTLAALLPVLSLLIVGSWWLGAIALRDFALALAVGLFIGAYSSIFIATPVLALLKEREPKYRALSERLGRTTGDFAGARGDASGRPAVPAMATASATASASTSADGIAVARPVPTSGLTHPPRPRKKKKR